MKKFGLATKINSLLILTFLFTLSFNKVSATHYAAVDMTYTCLGGNQYEFTLKVYRDCFGATVGSSYTLNYASLSSCGASGTFTVSQVSKKEVSQVCSSLLPSTTCASKNNPYPGMEEYIYKGTVTFPAQCSDWRVHFNANARNNAITNLQGPGGKDIYAEAIVNNSAGQCNNSPTFNSIPVLYSCAGDVVNFNNGAVDPDGDSIYYTLVQPKSGPTTLIPYSNSSYSPTNPFPTVSGFNFNNLSGAVSYTSSGIQQPVVSVLISTYDSLGNFKGSITRDIQFITINCGPTAFSPTVSGVNYSNNYTYDVCYQQPFCFDVYSLTPDVTKPISLTYNNGIPGGTFTSRISGDSTIGTFCWNPGNQAAGTFYFTLIAEADLCPTKRLSYFTYTITIDTNYAPNCVNPTVYLSASGNIVIDSSDLTTTVTNCAVSSIDLSQTLFDCSNTGTNNVTVTTTYSNGLVKTCQSTVTVIDTIKTSNLCHDTTIYLDGTGNSILNGNLVVNTNQSPCPINTISLTQSAFNCSHIGTNPVQVSITDIYGNTDYCTSNVTVLDTISPNVSCNDYTAFLSPSGVIVINTNAINNGSTDNCGIASVTVNSQDSISYGCNNIGTNTITLTVTDYSGNSSSCTSTVTVVDTVTPVISCKNATIYLNNSGQYTIDSSYVLNSASAACGIQSVTLSKYNFDCSNLGTNNVVVTVTDNNNNVSTCTAQVIVIDTIKPTAQCQNISLYLDASGNGTITANQINNGSSDACGISSLSLDKTSFNCSNVGVNTVVLTVTDGSGNSSTCSASVTVIDTVKPVANCQNISAYLNTSGVATITANQVNNGSSDACGISTLSLNKTSFNCSEVGSNTVVLTVTDANGNTSNCSATVNVIDTVKPTALCKSPVVTLGFSGIGTIDSSHVDNGSFDNCGIATVKLSRTTFDCSDVNASVQVTLIVTDVNGNVDSCTTGVTVLDKIKPTPACKDTTLYLDSNGQLTIDSSYLSIGNFDNCGVRSVTLSKYNFGCSDVGTNSVILTYTDVYGNFSQCIATLTVLDTIAPTLSCNDTTIYLDASGNASIDSSYLVAQSNAACGVSTISLSKYNFDCSNVGNNFVTVTSTDSNNNSSSCTANVTVLDTINPTLSCQNITVHLDASGNVSINSAMINNGSTDNCGIASLVIRTNTPTNGSFDCSNVGTNSVTLIATDVNGNIDSCSATVTVLDTIKPTVYCQNQTIYLDSNGQFIIDSSLFNNGSFDNCGIATIKVKSTGFNSDTIGCSSMGINNITLVVTDNNGNADSCSAVLTVLDTIKPVLSCQDTTIYLDATGNFSIDSSYVTGNASAACGVASIVLSQYNFNCSHVGANTVNVTATDNNSNVSNCTAIVTVLDTTKPNVQCKNIDAYLDASGNIVINASDIDNGSSDNCGIAGMTITTSTSINGQFTCSNVGTNTVTLTVTDNNGNVDSCTATVTVHDTIKPTVNCQNLTVFLDSTGSFQIDSSYINSGSFDNCGIATMTLRSSSFTSGNLNCSHVGSNAVTLIVTDNNGNVDSCSANIIVIDTINPTLVCKDTTIYLDSLGLYTIDSSYVIANVGAACGLDTLFLSQYNFNCTHVGNNPVTIVTTDKNKNTSSCVSTVTVLDTIKPTVVCQNINAYLNAAGQITISSADIDNGSFDNCGISSMSISTNTATNGTFDCTNVGVNSVTLIVTDNNGNIDSCIATVTVIDTIKPTASCQNISVYLDSNGVYQLDSSSINGGSFDNCGIATMTLRSSTITGGIANCTNVGTNSVTLIVTDVNGNIDSCVSIVNIIDTIKPELTCQDTTIYLDAFGQITIDPSYVVANSNAACGMDTIFLSQHQFACPHVGPNTVTVTAIDNNGNISTCSSIITVLDTIKPVVSCQNINVYLDPSGSISIDSSDIDNGSTDNCGIASMNVITGTATNGTFDCTNLGTNTVTLIVTDIYGNIDSCTATVTVIDTVKPTVSCQNINVYLDSNGTFQLDSSSINNGSSDNCGIATMTINSYTITGGLANCNNIGVNTVTLIVTDFSGNVDSCSSTVTVIDTIKPVLACQDTTIYLDALGQYTIDSTYVVANSNAACGIASVTLSQYNFGCAHVGTNLVTITATDNNSNVSTCTSTVTVIDSIAPTAICKDTTVYLDLIGRYIIDSTYINNGSFDNCGIATVALSKKVFICNDLGVNTVTMTVTDVNGNVSICTANVTVLDTIKPVVSCQNFTVHLDSNGQATVDSSMLNFNSSDNCDIATMTLSQFNGTFTCNNVGVNYITLVVTDQSGNSDSCVSTIVVKDTIKPTLICQDTTIYLNGSGQYTIDSSYVHASVQSACGIKSISLSKYVFSCADTGANTVTVVATDNNGNISTCQATVTVIDNQLPTVICQNINLYLNHMGVASIDSSDIDNGSNDNCGIKTLKLSKENFDCSDLGPNPVILTATDNNGNVSTCTAVVTVLDTVKPIVSCNNLNIYLDATGTYTIDSSYLDGGSTDNCGIKTIKISKSIFNCSDAGVNYVTVTVTDSSGNFDTCISTVNVLDTITPVVSCKDTTVYLDASGRFRINPRFVNNGSYDNCDMIMTVYPDRFTCQDTGINQVTLIIRDSSNNVDSCHAFVTVLDTIAATVVCQDITVYLDDYGAVAIVPDDVDGGTFDNCGNPFLWVDKHYFTCDDQGPNNVTLYAKDASGNIDSCIAIVTVVDTIAPVVICPADFRDSIADACTYEVPNFIELTTIYDNCAYEDLVISQVPAPYTIVDMNPYTNPLAPNPLVITITATDANGNTEFCSFNVTTECFPSLEIPQFFSPNGDGHNDKWEIIGIEAYPNSKVEIFNRLGKLVYTKTSYDNSWGAEPNTGVVFQVGKSDGMLPTGTYFYRVDLGDGFGAQQGFVHIRF